MPSRKKKYNARFPAGRIKKIMQSDEEIGKVAKAVPVIISKTLELFVESILRKTLKITNSRNYKTLSPSHLKQCIMAESKFDFLRELVKNVPDISAAEADGNYQDDDAVLSSSDECPDSDTPSDLSRPSTSAAMQQNKANFRNLSVSQSTTNGHEKRHTEVLKRSYSLNGHATAASSSASLTQNNNSNNNNNNNNHININCKAPSQPPPLISLRSDQRVPTATVTSGSYSNATSVIKHTKSLDVRGDSVNEVIPNKIARSDSTPVGTGSSSFGCLGSATAIASASAISSSILNYDFSAKSPVVQLDYSQLALPMNKETAATVSCPSALDFNQPVINIDLSNLVPPIGGSSTTAAATAINSSNNNNNNINHFHQKPANEVMQPTPVGAVAKMSATAAAEMPIATISIGSKPKAGQSSSASSSSASIQASTTSSSAPLTTPKLSIALELDEDYDNI